MFSSCLKKKPSTAALRERRNCVFSIVLFAENNDPQETFVDTQEQLDSKRCVVAHGAVSARFVPNTFKTFAGLFATLGHV